MLKFGAENLRRGADRITSLGDLGRALLLREWRNESPDSQVTAVEQEVWANLRWCFTKEARRALNSDDPLRAQAAAALVGEMATEVHRAGIRTESSVEGILAGFTENLVKLSRSSNPAVRTTAVRTLGQIRPDPKVAAAALDHALEDDDVALRRAAAGALVSLLKEAPQLVKPRPAGVGHVNPLLGLPASGAPGAVINEPPNEPRPDALATAIQIIPVAGRALADKDAAVRRLGADAVQQGALRLQDSVILPKSLGFPPPGRELTAEERDQIEGYRKEVEEERKVLAPLTRVLARQVPGLDGAAADPDLQVCVASNRALEALADARQMLVRRAASVPAPPGKEDGDRHPEDPLGAALQEAVPVLAKRLSADEVRARLASLYVLETLGTEAAPAAADMVKALADKDPFVRWGATRALGKMGLKGEAAAKAVASLAPLLKDDNADVRLGAAAALQRCGAAAKGAVKELRAAVKDGDDEVRLRVIATLAALGRVAGAEAVPALAAALKAEDAEVRAAAAGAGGAAGQDRPGGAADGAGRSGSRRPPGGQSRPPTRAGGEQQTVMRPPRFRQANQKSSVNFRAGPSSSSPQVRSTSSPTRTSASDRELVNSVTTRLGRVRTAPPG
jgi:HEAT repeat protein